MIPMSPMAGTMTSFAMDTSRPFCDACARFVGGTYMSRRNGMFGGLVLALRPVDGWLNGNICSSPAAPLWCLPPSSLKMIGTVTLSGVGGLTGVHEDLRMRSLEKRTGRWVEGYSHSRSPTVKKD